MAKSEKVNQDRKDKYELLRKAGYTPREANIYKDYNMDFVEMKIKNKSDELAKGLEMIKKIIGGDVNKK